MAASKPDHWTAQSYTSAADFVHKLTTTVTSYLAASPGDSILDLGCGDGKLTAQLATAVGPSGRVLGLDSSANLLSAAASEYPQASHPNLAFQRQDCSQLASYAAQNKGAFDKVFSNAALHWILRDPACRAPTMSAVFDVLKPGGRFVFEMGGAGNVEAVHAALVAGLVREGIDDWKAHEASPWFFPSDVLMGKMLQEAGFEVEKAELEYRPTRLEEGSGGGVQGWVELMGAQFLDKVPADRRAAVVEFVTGLVEPVCRREEGGMWLGYVRCRAVARKP